MNIDVIEITTQDGLTLPAGYFAPTGTAAGPIDAVLVMTGTFYQDLWVALARELAAHGYPTLTMSGRTHSVVWRDLHSGTNHGSAYQSLDTMIIDCNAAFQALRDRGFQRIALYGHSISGTRVLYYAAHAPDPSMVAVISSAGLTYTDDAFQHSGAAAGFATAKAQAEAAVAAGNGEALLTFESPQPNWVMAPRAWLETYASGKYDPGAWGEHIQVPVLRIECELESPLYKPLVQRSTADLLRVLPPNPAHRHVEIPGADHYFIHEFPAACRTVIDWLDTLPG